MTYLVSDVHGRLDRLTKLLKEIAFGAEDELYILGDAADRGPDGLKIFEFVMNTPNVHMIRGNHELLLLEALDSPADETCMARWYRNGGRVTHEAVDRLSEQKRRELFDFLYALPINLELSVNGKTFLLSHGAPLMCFGKMETKYTDPDRFAVWARPTAEDWMPEDKITVFGHTSVRHFHDVFPLAIWYGKNRINIDCGCAYEGDAGRLGCLRLEDMKEFYAQ